jgi:hypothetical protein
MMSFPFRLDPTGSVACVEQESDQANAEQVAVLCLTFKGERTLVPGFGVTDPTFQLGGLEVAEVRAGIDQFGPPVEILGVEEVYAQPTQFVQLRLGPSKKAS